MYIETVYWLYLHLHYYKKTVKRVFQKVKTAPPSFLLDLRRFRSSLKSHPLWVTLYLPTSSFKKLILFSPNSLSVTHIYTLIQLWPLIHFRQNFKNLYHEEKWKTSSQTRRREYFRAKTFLLFSENRFYISF